MRILLAFLFLLIGSVVDAAVVNTYVGKFVGDGSQLTGTGYYIAAGTNIYLVTNGVLVTVSSTATGGPGGGTGVSTNGGSGVNNVLSNLVVRIGTITNNLFVDAVSVTNALTNFSLSANQFIITDGSKKEVSTLNGSTLWNVYLDAAHLLSNTIPIGVEQSRIAQLRTNYLDIAVTNSKGMAIAGFVPGIYNLGGMTSVTNADGTISLTATGSGTGITTNGGTGLNNVFSNSVTRIATITNNLFVDAVSVTNALTNFSLSASAPVATDGSKKEISMGNATVFWNLTTNYLGSTVTNTRGQVVANLVPGIYAGANMTGTTNADSTVTLTATDTGISTNGGTGVNNLFSNATVRTLSVTNNLFVDAISVTNALTNFSLSASQFMATDASKKEVSTLDGSTLWNVNLDAAKILSNTIPVARLQGPLQLLTTNYIGVVTNSKGQAISGFVPGVYATTGMTGVTNADGTVTLTATASGTGIATNGGSGVNNIFSNATLYASSATNGFSVDSLSVTNSITIYGTSPTMIDNLTVTNSQTNLQLTGSAPMATDTNKKLISMGNAAVFWNLTTNYLGTTLTNSKGQALNGFVPGIYAGANMTGTTNADGTVSLTSTGGGSGSTNITDDFAYDAIINNIFVRTNLSVTNGTFKVTGTGSNYMSTTVFSNTSAAITLITPTNPPSDGYVLTATGTAGDSAWKVAAAGAGTGIATNGGTGVNNLFSNATVRTLSVTNHAFLDDLTVTNSITNLGLSANQFIQTGNSKEEKSTLDGSILFNVNVDAAKILSNTVPVARLGSGSGWAGTILSGTPAWINHPYLDALDITNNITANEFITRWKSNGQGFYGVAAGLTNVNGSPLADQTWIESQFASVGAVQFFSSTTNAVAWTNSVGEWNTYRTNNYKTYLTEPSVTTTQTLGGLVANAYILALLTTNTYTVIGSGPAVVNSYLYSTGGGGTFSGHFEFYILDGLTAFEVGTTTPQTVTGGTPTLFTFTTSLTNDYVATNVSGANMITTFKIDTPGSAGTTANFVQGSTNYSSHMSFQRPLRTETILGSQIAGNVPADVATNDTRALTLTGPVNIGILNVTNNITNGVLTASRMVLSDANKALVSATASGAVPIDADGSATTAAQLNALGMQFGSSTLSNVSLGYLNGTFQLTNGVLIVSNSTAAGKPWAKLEGDQLTLSNGVNAIQSTLTSSNLNLAGTSAGSLLTIGAQYGLSNVLKSVSGSNDLVLLTGYQTNNVVWSNGVFWIMDEIRAQHKLGVASVLYASNSISVAGSNWIGSSLSVVGPTTNQNNVFNQANQSTTGSNWVQGVATVVGSVTNGGQTWISNTVVVLAGGENITGVITNANATWMQTNAMTGTVWAPTVDCTLPIQSLPMWTTNLDIKGVANVPAIGSGKCAEFWTFITNNDSSTHQVTFPVGTSLFKEAFTTNITAGIFITNNRMGLLKWLLYPQNGATRTNVIGFQQAN